MRVIYLGAPINQAATGGQRRTRCMLNYLRKSPHCEVAFVEPKKQHIRRNFVLTNLWYIVHFAAFRGQDVIILQDYTYRFYFFAFNWLAKLLSGAKLVCLLNAFYFQYRTSGIKNWIDRWVSALFLKPMDLIVTAGEAASQELHTIFKPKCAVRSIYPALRSEFILAEPHTQRADNHADFRILFVGRLHPVKGVEYLVEAIGLLRDHHCIQASIVGDSMYHPGYQRKIMRLVDELHVQDNIKFVSEIRDVNRLVELYREADVFVLPSVWETSPIVLAEAMCLGLPIIASEVGGVPEFVESGVTGILYPPGDPQALAAAISMLIENKKELHRLRSNAIRHSILFRQRTWKDVGEEYYQALLKLVE